MRSRSHKHRGTIKQWDRAGFGRILKKEQTSARRRIREATSPSRSRSAQHMYPPSLPGGEARRQNQSPRMTSRWRCRGTRNVDIGAKNEKKNVYIYIKHRQREREREGARERGVPGALLQRAAAFPHREGNPTARVPRVFPLCLVSGYHRAIGDIKNRDSRRHPDKRDREREEQGAPSLIHRERPTGWLRPFAKIRRIKRGITRGRK